MSNTNTNLQTQTSSVLQNDTVSSCSISNIQEKTQLSRSRCMHSLKEIKSLFKFLSETLQDYGTMPIFKRTTKFENAFNSEFEERMRKYTRYNAQSFNDAMICTIDSIRKYMLEIILHQQRTLHLLKQKTLMQTQEDHSNQTQALNSDSLKVYLVVKTNSCSEKRRQIEVKQFRDTLLQHLGNVKKSVAERTRHQRQKLRTDSTVQDDNSRSGNDTDADDAYIRPIYDEEPMAEEIDVLETMNIELEHSVATLRKENETLKQHYKDLYDSIKITRSKTTEQTTSLLASNTELKAQIQEKIFTGHRFSPNKTSAVYEKTSPRSDLRWKPTGRIFKSVGLRWIPTGKLFDSCTSKVDSEPPHGSNVDIPNIHECKQTLDVSAGTSINVQKEQSLDLSAVSTEVHQAAETVTTSNELDLLFGPLFDEYFNGENQVVLKSSAVTTTDASNKRQQQPDSTSSTSTLATTVTANGNFDL
ncbi:hypothetical protein Tco_0104286 [Tanacetum coccineum]